MFYYDFTIFIMFFFFFGRVRSRVLLPLLLVFVVALPSVR